MLRNTLHLIGHKLLATDGSIGAVHDLSFDDRSWTIRYVVADTGGWLLGRQVLLSPACFGVPDWQEQAIPVSLTKEQIEQSPSIDADQTVSRHHEMQLQQHFGWPPYWNSYPLGGIGWIPLPAREPDTVEEGAETSEEPTLRSVNEVRSYHIQAQDGEMGRVHDFVFDDEDWAIRYIVVDTNRWLPGKETLVAPEWISSIRWDERKVHVDLKREAITAAPEYDSRRAITREYEEILHDHYGRAKYWRR